MRAGLIVRNIHDRIVVATGNARAKGLPIEGMRIEQVDLALNLMRRVNAGQKVVLKGKGVVIGGGSVAFDTARTALRLGADEVTIMCLESGDALPAHKWEIEEAKEEGIKVVEGVSPLEMVGCSSKLQGVRYARIDNFTAKPFSYDIIEGSEAVMEADFAVVAVGQTSEAKWPENPQVVFAGDIASGKCSVIDAMASGRQAAIKVDQELRQYDYSDLRIDHELTPGDLGAKIYPAVRDMFNFPQIRRTPAQARVGSFETVEQAFTEDEAVLETFRCLQCGYNSVDPEKCIGCGVCQKVCPKGDVITLVRPDRI